MDFYLDDETRMKWDSMITGEAARQEGDCFAPDVFVSRTRSQCCKQSM